MAARACCSSICEGVKAADDRRQSSLNKGGRDERKTGRKGEGLKKTIAACKIYEDFNKSVLRF